MMGSSSAIKICSGAGLVGGGDGTIERREALEAGGILAVGFDALDNVIGDADRVGGEGAVSVRLRAIALPCAFEGNTLSSRSASG